MTRSADPANRTFRIVAQDPAVKVGGRILTTEVEIAAEDLQPGPWGCRVQVIDYDSSTGVLLKPLAYEIEKDGTLRDPFANATDATILADPRFHAQNVYAIVMKTLARFEFALGRRIAWAFPGHQLKVAPHAFADANAFYSRRDEGLFFGYFPGRRGNVFSCLSHDVVAHETTHAILDGLRERYTDPSSPDQAAFHEGFSDVIAILSVFALPDVVDLLVDRSAGGGTGPAAGNLVALEDVTPEALKGSVLLGLAEEMGQELANVRGAALRQSALLKPSPKSLEAEEFQEPHRRGEILVAAMMNAFLAVWAGRLESLGQVTSGHLDRNRVVEEGSAAADYLLTMAIRALDYSMPVHMEFRDYLCALLTADHEIRPDDSKYRFRDHLRESFKAFGILPSAVGGDGEAGLWLPPQEDLAVWPKGKFSHQQTHFESLTRDPEEVFRFLWQNRRALGISDGAFTRVLSVRPCLRIGPDGFFLRETVAEYIQVIDLEARELGRMKIDVPDGMPPDTQVTLYGGAVVIFDEFGHVKFSINNRIDNRARQSRRLKYLWDYGHFDRGATRLRRFSTLHRLRAGVNPGSIREEWH